MFAELNAILNTSPDTLNQGEWILVSDRRADASFLVHHFLSFYLRAGCKVCFLGLAQSFSHYTAVSQRLGVSLAQAKEKGQLVFLEGLKESLDVLLPDTCNTESRPLDFLSLLYDTSPRGEEGEVTAHVRGYCMSDPQAGLRGLYDFVRASLAEPEGGAAGGSGPPVLLVDDLTVLLGLGVSVGAVLDFSHYCFVTVCSRLKGNMVTLVRCDGEEDEDEGDGDEEGPERLLKGLTHPSSLTLHVQGLPTGFCRDIHGQVEVSWRKRRKDQPSTQRKLFQYKVHDKGASFFARGTSSAVL